LRHKITIIHFLLFLVASQVYPFVHIHDHNNSGDSKLVICVHPPNHIQHDNHADQEFFRDHQYFKIDWDRLKIQETTKKISEKYSIKFALKDYSNNILNISHFNFNGFLGENELFSKISNKSPPFIL
jgi:hypothetical protein